MGGLLSDCTCCGDKGGYKASKALRSPKPANSVPATSWTSWMLSSTIVSIRDEVDEFRDLLGFDEFKGQGGSSLDFNAALTLPSEMAILLERLVPAARSVTRQRSYLVGGVSSMQKLAARREELRSGSMAAVMLQSNKLWDDATGNETSLPEHYVAIKDVECPYEGDVEKVRILAFSLGNLEERILTLKQYSRIAWELIVVEFDRPCHDTKPCQNKMEMS